MKVFVVYDNCPPLHGDPAIMSIYITKKSAEKEEARLKRIDGGYPYQYVEVQPHTLRGGSR